MTKLEVQQRVLKNGEPIGLDLFEWDEKTKTFSSGESGLVLDFRGMNGCVFNTGSNCTFSVASHCTFSTGSYCTFKTGNNCTFDTGYCCIFKTGVDCIFKTGVDCVFETSHSCTFNTGSDCVVIRRDVYEVIEIPENTKIRLNECRQKGYKIIEDKHKIIIDGREIELSEGGIIMVDREKVYELVVMSCGTYYSVGTYRTFEDLEASIGVSFMNMLDTNDMKQLYRDVYLDRALAEMKDGGSIELFHEYIIDYLKDLMANMCLEYIVHPICDKDDNLLSLELMSEWEDECEGAKEDASVNGGPIKDIDTDKIVEVYKDRIVALAKECAEKVEKEK